MSSVLASRTIARHILPPSRGIAPAWNASRAESRTEIFTSSALFTSHVMSLHPRIAYSPLYVAMALEAASISHSSPISSSTSGSKRPASKNTHGGKKSSASGHSVPTSSFNSNTSLSASTSSTPSPPPDQPFPAPYHHRRPAPPSRSPIAKWVLASPLRTAFFLKIGDWLGYGSPKQLAANRSKVIYEICSEVARGHESKFWYDTLSLPPSFQSWFTITNLHVWLVTVRLRALPPPHGRPFIQALIDHFFLDVEDRVRAVFGKKAPERLVTRHMKILREQWGGLGLAFDHALITGDKDMASAIWRNFLGARGARGIAYPEAGTLLPDVPPSLVGGTDQSSRDPKKPEDPSSGGVVDFEGDEVDKYVLYPQLMLALAGYVRRELVRLEEVSDADILGGVGLGLRGMIPSSDNGTGPTKDLRDVVKFGKVRDAARKVGADLGIF